MPEYLLVFATLLAALALFVAGRPRYDLTAMLALLALTLVGVVPPAEAFQGFGHPAVVTVAAVLVASRGLQNAGVVDFVAKGLVRVGPGVTAQVLALCTLVALASAFMNNVGALALLLPVALRVARKTGTQTSALLMPLAFASLLGGLVTLIGTPPNIIIASVRAQHSGTPFRMFDFAPVGGAVALAGILFTALVGWRLLPRRNGRATAGGLFRVEDYVTEVRVPERSPVAGTTVRELEAATEGDAVVLGVIRGRQRYPAPSGYEFLAAGDVLIVKADPDALRGLVDGAGLELVGDKGMAREALGSDEVTLVEAVVTPGAAIEHKSPRGLMLRRRYGINLLGISRQGADVHQRLRDVQVRAGDVLLLQGRTDALQEAVNSLGLLPLAERGLRLGQPRRILLALGLFAAALAASGAGILPAPVALAGAAAAMILTGVVGIREAYEAVDGSIIVLLGAMLPVGQALDRTGGAQLLGDAVRALGGALPPAVTLGVVLVATMFLSDLINNAAAAVLMAPIAVNVARGMAVSPDPFLMAVAIGASCAFLTPIGHQSNTLVMGPGGYRFGDYWRLGLPLEAVIAVVALLVLPRVWPF